MTQEINLYQPIFRRQRKVFSAAAMLQVLGLVVLGFVLIYGYGQWQGQALDRELRRMEQQRDASRKRLQRLQREQPDRQPSRTQEREKERLEQRVRQQRRVASYLTEEELGLATGFSSHLKGLARQRLDGMWLETIRLYDGGRHMDLLGTALAERLVPQYVTRLSEEPAFEGTGFRSIRLHRDEDNRRQIRFELRSVIPETQREAAR